MRVNTANALVNKLTGTEIFKLVMNTYLERVQHKEPTFSDADLDKAIASLSNRPEERRAYYHWGEAVDVIHTIQYETRLAAMDAIWKLGIFTECIVHAIQPIFTQKEKGNKFKKQLDDAHIKIVYVKELFIHISELHLILDAFSEVLSLDLSIMTRHEMGLVAEYIEIYNKVAECVNGIIGTEIPLPALDINRELLFPDKKDRFIKAIKQGESGSFWQVLRELKQPVT